MSDMTIGALARIASLAPSAVRYYESQGLLPKPARRGGQRRYSSQDLGRLRIIQLALAAGFTVAETRTFLTGFSATVAPAARWRALAKRKLAELDEQMERCSRMKKLLESNFHCKCPSLANCERGFAGERNVEGSPCS
ncbi:MAG TPA: MerR family transcriptional regulator [Steroidobacteraceae bacterium]|nr:MerR family transcriptional regulator [Steroidobacteraceae bacterium]